jgi:hypothetical protein
MLECFESRMLPSTYLVTNINDAGTGSATITANLINDAEVRPMLATDTLEITGNYTQDATGTLTQLGTLTVDGLLTWAGGAMGSSGTVNANGGLSLSGVTVKTLDGRTLNDGGAGAWTGMGNLNMGHRTFLNLLGAASLLFCKGNRLRLIFQIDN